MGNTREAVEASAGQLPEEPSAANCVSVCELAERDGYTADFPGPGQAPARATAGRRTAWAPKDTKSLLEKHLTGL